MKLGKKHSKKSIEKISEAMKGRKHSAETKKKMSKIKKGSRNGMWVGDKPCYITVHMYLRRNHKQPAKCSLCKKEKTTLDIANITNIYNRDIKNYNWLCRSCHMKSDGRLEKLKKSNLEWRKTTLRNPKGQFIKKGV